MHQGIGLEAFNAMPMRRAVHAIFECCYSVPLAADLCRGRAFASHDDLFGSRRAVVRASEESIDTILQAYPDIGRGRQREVEAEQCAIWCDDPR